MLDLGYDVTGVDIKSGNIDSRAKQLNYDIFNGSSDIFNELGAPDRLIHLAWKDGFVHNAASHIEFLPKHLSFISQMINSGCRSVSVMGSMHEIGYYEGAVNDDTPSNPRSLYGISKNSLRQALSVLAAQSPDFSLKWIRAFYITGDDTKNNSIFTKILKMASEGKKTFPFTAGTNKYDFITIEQLALQIALASVQDEVNGIINCCSGKPVPLKDKVEAFIKENSLDIKPSYGAFPDRPYDSGIIYGDSSKIRLILEAATGKYSQKNDMQIKEQLDMLS